MEEKEEVKRKLIIHTVYNIIGFATIFIEFGIFVFFIVKNITYKRIDNELKTGEERIIQNQSDNFENFSFLSSDLNQHYYRLSIGCKTEQRK